MMKRCLILALIVLMLLALSACGKKESVSSPDEKTPAETTSVLETTADGGTVEQDSEGNIITRDANGNVVSVEDKNGNIVDTDEYIATHPWIEKPDAASSDDISQGANSSNAADGEPSTIENEGEVPVIIATTPDEENIIEIPDI